MFVNPFYSGFVSNSDDTKLFQQYKNNLSSMVDGCEVVSGKDVYFASNLSCCSDSNHVYTMVAGYPTWSNSDLINMAGEKGNAYALREAYYKYGEELFTYIGNRFMLAVYDASKKKLIIGLDKIGFQHVYFSHINDGFVFGSSTDAIFAHPNLSRQIENQGIYNYFYYHSIPSPTTIFTGVEKLVNGAYLVYENNKIRVTEYWEPKFNEANERSLEVLSSDLNRIIEAAVSRNIDTKNVGAFLSGGLDSSTISGYLAKQIGGAKTFSIGFNAKGYDEVEYARITSSAFNTEQHEYYVSPQDVYTMLPKLAKAYDEPFGNSSALPSYFCARLAKENNVNRLLGGDGGDEIFAGNERYVSQKIFEMYKRIPVTLRKYVMEPLIALSYANKVPLLRKVVSYIDKANIPLPDRMEVYNFLHRINVDEIFSNEFLASVNTELPLEQLRNTYNKPKSASDLNRMLFLDWKRTLHDNDLVKVNTACELAGVEVVYPLLDDELLEFSMSIPSDIKINNNELRWFYKQGIKEFLPREIIYKNKHGFGLPFGVWMKSDKNLQELAYDSVNTLKNRGIVKSSFIDNAINLHRTGHASYYGELIWIMMVLELWLSNQ